MKKALGVMLVCAIATAGYWVYKTKEKSVVSVELIPREVLFGNPEKSMVRLSPNGQYISYGSPLNGVQNIFIAKSDTPHDAKSITEDKNNSSWAC